MQVRLHDIILILKDDIIIIIIITSSSTLVLELDYLMQQEVPHWLPCMCVRGRR